MDRLSLPAFQKREKKEDRLEKKRKRRGVWADGTNKMKSKIRSGETEHI